MLRHRIAGAWLLVALAVVAIVARAQDAAFPSKPIRIVVGFTAGIAVSIAIVDTGGHLILLERMEGGRFHTVHSSTTKAVAAASNRRPSRREARGW